MPLARSSAVSSSAALAVRPPLLSRMRPARGAAAWMARTRARSSSSVPLPIFTLRRVKPARVQASASAPASSMEPMVMVTSVVSVGSAPPKNAQSGMPARRASASRTAVSSAHWAEALSPTKGRIAAERARYLRASAPSAVGRAAFTAAMAWACVSPLNAGKGAASP